MKSTYIFFAFIQLMLNLFVRNITFEFVYYWIEYLQYHKDYFFFTGKVVVIRKQVNFLLILTLAHATSEWDEPFLPFSRQTLQ